MLHETRFIPPEFWIDEALIRRHGPFFKEIHQLLVSGRLEGSVGIIGVREVDPIRRITDPDFLPVDGRLVNAFNWFQEVLLVYNSTKNTWGNPAGHIDRTDRSFWRHWPVKFLKRPDIPQISIR